MDHPLGYFLQQLKNSSYSTSCVRDAVETLLKLHRNIYFNKNDSKYRKLQLHNETFCNKVWKVTPAQRFMLHCGWSQVGGELHFDNDSDLLIIINVLLEHRFVQPYNSEWKPEMKIENLHTSKQHEEMLRAEAALKRKKELEEFEKDKKFRKELHRKIIQEMAAEREYKKRLQHVAPVARRETETNRQHNTRFQGTSSTGRRLLD